MDQGRIKAAAAVAVLAAALCACGSSGNGSGNPGSRLSASEADQPLSARAPTELAALREQASELLAGGKAAFEARLRQLRGHPVVVNKWASWCGPCRFEFPFFQELAVERGEEVAFLGVDADDSDDAARTFLEALPLPYPSYSDPDHEIGDLLQNAREFPATGFYDSDGELAFVHRGGYASKADLEADIERYAR